VFKYGDQVFANARLIKITVAGGKQGRATACRAGFCGLHASWLMMGEGTMYEQMGRDLPVNLFDSTSSTGENEIPPEPVFDQEHRDDPIDQSSEAGLNTDAEDSAQDQAAPVATGTANPADAGSQASGRGERKVVQVMVIYDDDTFKTLKPAQ
jgi:hypothetical protein